MKKKILFLLILNLFIAKAIIAKENIEIVDIDFKFYSSGVPTYYYLGAIKDTKGDIFLDWEDNLYVVNKEGTFKFDSRGALVSHINERVQIPVKADKTGNSFIVNQDKIIKLSPNKDIVSTFKIDKSFQLLQIDDKNNYYFLSPRKEYKKKEYQDEIKTIEEKQKELSKPVKYQKSIAIEEIDRKISVFYRDEQRDLNWDLKELKRDYDNLWNKLEIETVSTERDKLKIKLDDIYNRMINIQDRLRFIDKDIDDLRDRKKIIEEQGVSEADEKNKENQDEIYRLNEEKAKFAKLIEDDLKMNYEISIYTEDKYLVKSYPVPLIQEGLPLSSCNVIVSDKDGNFYGSDGKRIYIYDWDGNLLASFDGSSQKDENKSISQLAVDSKKNIYVMDQLNNEILKFGINKPSLNLLNK